MRSRRGTGLLAILTTSVAILLTPLPPASAQLPGEPKAPPAYDIIGDAQYRSKLGAPDDRVKQAQQVLRTRGYYQGPIDGLLSPQTRRAVWNFQKAEGVRLSGRLDAQTMTALGLAETPRKDKEESASTPGSSPSALPSDLGGARPSGARDLQAP